MFDLKKFEKAIREYAEVKKVDLKVAVDHFVYNLALMRPQLEGFDTSLDFRALGQEWNKLSSDVRNKQKAEMFKAPTRATKTLKGEL